MLSQPGVIEYRLDDELKLLLLAGGLSTRMGQAKHLLQLPDGRPLYHHIIQQVKYACPDLRICYVSLRKGSLDLETLVSTIESMNIIARVIYDDDEQELNSAYQDDSFSIGPAGGMRAAHLKEPGSRFLVLACDFPLLTTKTISLLLQHYQDPVTCYQNRDGFCEPLLAIWSSNALEKLCDNMQQGNFGPSRTIKQLSGHRIPPPSGYEHWLLNTNTKAEWRQACDMIQDG